MRAGEKVKADDPLPNWRLAGVRNWSRGKRLVPLTGLRAHEATANVMATVHLRDMIDVGLIDRSMLDGLPAELAERLDALLTDAGR